MQPYFFPYLGYFQLIYSVDKFVIYDNIQYTKKGWFNRNRFLCNGSDKYFTISITKDSDYLAVVERKVAKDFDRKKVKNQIRTAYAKAPYFDNVFPMFCECIDYENDNLFEYIYYSVKRIATYLSIDTEIVVSSNVVINHELKGTEKVIALCKALDATQYINPIGGQLLYDKETFKNEGIELSFIKMDSIEYKQFDNAFVEALSILDVLMFNSVDEVKEMLNKYTLY